jgi:hypothetical protein
MHAVTIANTLIGTLLGLEAFGTTMVVVIGLVWNMF